MNFLKNSYSCMLLEKGELDASGAIGSESTMTWHPRFFDLLLYKLVEILDMNKLFGLSPRMITSILQAGMNHSTHHRIALMESGRLLCDASNFETVRHL